MKMTHKGKRFDDIETIQSNATRELKAISKSAFEDCFKELGQVTCGKGGERGMPLLIPRAFSSVTNLKLKKFMIFFTLFMY